MTTDATSESCDLLIEAGFVVPVEPHGIVLRDHAVAVAGNRILALLPIAEARARFQPTLVVPRPHGVLIPGLVNAHAHNPMTLLRGAGQDLSGTAKGLFAVRRDAFAKMAALELANLFVNASAG